MYDYILCKECGGRREHDIRTGDIASCDVCGYPDEELMAQYGNLEAVGYLLCELADDDDNEPH